MSRHFKQEEIESFIESEKIIAHYKKNVALEKSKMRKFATQNTGRKANFLAQIVIQICLLIVNLIYIKAHPEHYHYIMPWGWLAQAFLFFSVTILGLKCFPQSKAYLYQMGIYNSAFELAKNQYEQALNIAQDKHRQTLEEYNATQPENKQLTFELGQLAYKHSPNTKVKLSTISQQQK